MLTISPFSPPSPFSVCSASRINIGIPARHCQICEYRSCGSGLKLKMGQDLSGAGLFEKGEVKDRFCRPGRCCRGRPNRRLLPESTVLKNLLDNRLFLDERNDLHLSTALRAFQRVYLVNALYQGCPGHAAFPAIRGIRFGLSRYRGRFFIPAQPTLLSLRSAT